MGRVAQVHTSLVTAGCLSFSVYRWLSSLEVNTLTFRALNSDKINLCGKMSVRENNLRRNVEEEVGQTEGKSLRGDRFSCIRPG